MSFFSFPGYTHLGFGFLSAYRQETDRPPETELQSRNFLAFYELAVDKYLLGGEGGTNKDAGCKLVGNFCGKKRQPAEDR